ncbi:cell envelope integrity EipB family protein [Methyloceanibacter caenitepidi]|nr:cell envelope integrity EipB family protein [Methyloceanibacter caenitepidi]
MNRAKGYWLSFLVFSAALGVSQQAWAIGASHLAPHRAVYEMSLGEARSGSGVTAYDGRMVFEFTGSACRGYSLNTRLVSQITDTQGETILADVWSSTGEAGDGKSFRFHSSQRLNHRLDEATIGRASRGRSDGAITVRLTQPESEEFSLAGPVLFPTQHSIALIERAASGQNVFQAKVYDGTEKGQRVFDTTAFIGRMVKPGEDTGRLEKVAEDQKLGDMPSWPISIGYFDLADGDLTPSYQIDFRLYENGVSRDLLIDYGEYTVEGKLSSLEYLKETKCK